MGERRVRQDKERQVGKEEAEMGFKDWLVERIVREEMIERLVSGKDNQRRD